MQIRAAVLLTCAIAVSAQAQRPVLAPAIRTYVSVDTPVVALVNARVIDGTGAPAREGQVVIVRDGRIVASGDAARVPVPSDALRIDLTGKSLLPGIDPETSWMGRVAGLSIHRLAHCSHEDIISPASLEILGPLLDALIRDAEAAADAHGPTGEPNSRAAANR